MQVFFLAFFARAGIRYRHLLRLGAYIILGQAGCPSGELEANRFYVGYANGKNAGDAVPLCSLGGLRILCAEPGSKTHEMGGQVIPVDHELITFRRDRLGIEARSN